MSERWVVFDLIGVLAEPSWRDIAQNDMDLWRRFKTGLESEDTFWGQSDQNAYRKLLSFRTDRLQLVRRLKREGFQVCVATNFSRDWLDHLLRKINAPDLFDAAVVSSVVGAAKPDRQFWDALLRRAPAGSVFVDDRKTNCDAASEAGFESVWAHPGCPLEAEVDEKLRLRGL